MTLEEKLQHFYDRSMEDAQNEGDQILNDYQQSLDQLYLEHQKEKNAAETERIETEKAALYREQNKELSQKQIDIRHELAEKQNEIKDEIFDLVKDKLLAFRETPEYEHWICRKIMISKKVANGETMEIYLDPADASKKSRIEDITDTKVQVSDTEFLGGIRVVIRSRKILIDDSFEALIADAKNRFSFEGGSEK